MITFLSLGFQVACAQATPPSTTTTIIAIGDIHADVEAAKKNFQMANIVNEAGEWNRQNVIVVQTGDITDRGPDGLSTLQWIKSLEEQAPKYNSEFHSLIGNHEAMNLMGDWRYVSHQDLDSFGGKEERTKVFSNDGEWRQWLLSHDAVLNIQGNIFVHGGVSLSYAKDASLLSKEIIDALSTTEKSSVLGAEGPLWYRGYILNDEEIACDEVEKVLLKMNATRMIMGHTTQRSGTIISRCQGQIIGIDTGLSSHYGGHLSALEIQGDTIYAIYPNKKVQIPTKRSTE